MKDEIAALLNDQFPHVDLAYLFGSQAKGQAQEGSDTDIAVLLTGQVTIDLKLALLSAFAGPKGVF